jgi:hypothetical protein
MSRLILIEGKKEEVAKILKQKFEYDGPFIERMVDIDPTGYKYIDYIGKNLEKLIPNLAGDKGGLNVQQMNAISNTFGVVIPWFHENVDRIGENDIWEAETKYRESVHEVPPNIAGIADHPKDITQYKDPTFIKYLMFVVNNRKSEKEKEKEAKSQAEKLYEDDEVLVIRPKSYESSCYYGANTKWCTTNKGTTSYFEQYNRDGLLYYFINKKSGLKIALFRNTKEKSYEIYNSNDKKILLADLFGAFPNQSELINDLIGSTEFIKALRNFVKGKIDSRELEKSDDAILDVKTREPLGQSIIVVNFFDDDNFFKSLGLHEDDIWFIKAIDSYYSGYEFMDSYTIRSDFEEGYVPYNHFNEENNVKLKTIASIIMPEKEFDESNDEDRSKLSKLLDSLFEREINSILSDYHSEKETEMMTTARASIYSELNSFLEKIGFEFKTPYNELKTTPANLIMWSSRLQLDNVNLISLFNQIAEFEGTEEIGGWQENSYDYQDDKNFDSESFNRQVERELDSILEKLEDSTSIKEFLEFRERIISKFKLNAWHTLPKDKKVHFRIEGFDKDNMKVIVRISHTTKGYRNIKLSEENFNNLLYQPELFDLED